MDLSDMLLEYFTDRLELQEALLSAL